MFRLFAALILVLMAAQSPAFADELAGSEWSPGAEPKPFIQFRIGGNVYGNASCNTFHGKYEITGSTISVGRLAMTRKHCGLTLGKAERAFVGALRSARTFEFSHLNPKLFAENGELLLQLRRRDWD